MATGPRLLLPALALAPPLALRLGPAIHERKRLRRRGRALREAGRSALAAAVAALARATIPR